MPKSDGGCRARSEPSRTKVSCANICAARRAVLLWHPASMVNFRTPGRRRWLAVIATALVLGLGAVSLRPMLDQAVRERIESASLRHGVVAQIGTVHVGVWPLLRLEACDFDLGHGVRLRADIIEATWSGRLRLTVRAATIAGPAGVKVSSPATVWDAAGILDKDLQLTLVEPQAGLSIRKRVDAAGTAWNIQARALNVGRLLEVQRDGHPLFDGGIADGGVDLRTSTDALRFHVDIGTRARAWACCRIMPPTIPNSAIPRT